MRRTSGERGLPDDALLRALDHAGAASRRGGLSQRSELIEWRICRPQPKGVDGWIFHSEGAQSIFGLSRARKILRELTRDRKTWEIRHVDSFEPPPPQDFNHIEQEHV